MLRNRHAIRIGVLFAALGVVGATPVPASTEITFQPAQNYPATAYGAGGAGGTLAVGDFNRDGYLDLVAAEPGSGVSVLLNRGDGSFGSADHLAVSSDTYTVAAGDLTGDGCPEIVSGGEQGRLTVLVGDRDGAFAPAESYPIGPFVQQIVIADLNRDGTADIAAVSGQSGQVSVLLGRGDGTFAAGAPGPITTGGAASMTTADVDGDANPDLIVSGSQRVYVLLGNGDGTFSGPTSHQVGNNPESVAVADVNNDGALDIVATTWGLWNGAVAVLLGDGAGGFQLAGTYPTGPYPLGVAIEGFDGDGNKDLAVAVQVPSQPGALAQVAGQLDLLRGDGQGAFVPAGSHAVATGPQTPVVADFDGNGLPDLAVAGSVPFGTGRDVTLILNGGDRPEAKGRGVARPGTPTATCDRPPAHGSGCAGKSNPGRGCRPPNR